MLRIVTAVLFMLTVNPSFSQVPKTSSRTELQLFEVEVLATQERTSIIPEELRLKCIHDGKISYLICPSASFEKVGIDRNHIIGIVVNPEAGLSESNLIESPYFREFIWQIASEHMDQSLMYSIINSEAKASAIIDQRVPDPTVPIKQIKEDIIGVYYLLEGRIVFDPNERYKLFSKYGFARLVPFIIEKLYE